MWWLTGTARESFSADVASARECKCFFKKAQSLFGISGIYCENDGDNICRPAVGIMHWMREPARYDMMQ